MKIVYVYRMISHYNGVERILVDKMNMLAEMYEYKVYLITVDQSNHPINYHLSRNINHVDLNICTHSPYRYNNWLKRFCDKLRVSNLFKSRFQNFIREEHPDVIVSVSDTLTNWIVRFHLNIPLVIESHSIFKKNLHWGDGKTPLSGLVYRWYTFFRIRQADVLVTLTASDARYWKRICRDVRIITNIAHLNPFPICNNNMSNHVIFVSRISYQKGITYLVEIWKKVFSHHPEWHLDVFGENESDVYFDLLKNSSSMNIHVNKPTPNIFNHYLNSSILLLTSVFEPFGLVLPEAMSCGLPVVTFDSDYGPREIVTDGVDGFLVPKFDVDFFAYRVCQLIEDPFLREKMGQAGVLSSKRYSAENIMPKWKELFEEVSIMKKNR